MAGMIFSHPRLKLAILAFRQPLYLVAKGEFFFTQNFACSEKQAKCNINFFFKKVGGRSALDCA